MVDQCAFVVGLRASDLKPEAFAKGDAIGLDIGKGFRPIDFGLALPQKVEVRAVQNVEGEGLGHCAHEKVGPTGIGPAF